MPVVHVCLLTYAYLLLVIHIQVLFKLLHDLLTCSAKNPDESELDEALNSVVYTLFVFCKCLLLLRSLAHLDGNFPLR